MPAPAKPQDRQPKKDAPFTFEAFVEDKEGKKVKKKFTLPPMSEESAMAVPGKYTMDAMLKPDDPSTQMALGFANLIAVKAPKPAMDALREMPTDKMLEVIMRWMGESEGSSD